MWFWIGTAIVVAAVLFALAWWSSGRSKHPLARPDAGAERDRARAYDQSAQHRAGPGGAGGSPL